MARYCESERIACHFVIYPYHAHILVLFQETGLWNAFWDWKQALTEVAERVNSSTRTVVLWDFSGPSSFTMEPVPLENQNSKSMQWYWEAGHFKKELGDLVLNQVLHPSRLATDLGARLEASNLSRLRTESERIIEQYRQERSGEIRVLMDIVRAAENSRN